MSKRRNPVNSNFKNFPILRNLGFFTIPDSKVTQSTLFRHGHRSSLSASRFTLSAPRSTLTQMTDYIAIDFALVPDRAVMDTAIQLNRRYCDDRIRLGWEMLPHISLLMGYVKRENLPRLFRKREKLFGSKPFVRRDREFPVFSGSNPIPSDQNSHPHSLLSTNLSWVDVGLDSLILSWGVEKSVYLVNLQNLLVEEFSDLLGNPHEKEESLAFFGEVRESTRTWTRNYITHSIGKNFDPHITIGFCREELLSRAVRGDSFPDDKVSDINFQPFSFHNFPLFRLGDYCTCRILCRPDFISTNESQSSDFLFNWEEIYTNTIYTVDKRPELTIRANKPNPPLDKLLKENGKKSWAYITAWNPHSEVYSPQENRHRNLHLKSMLDENWIVYSGKGIGSDTHPTPIPTTVDTISSEKLTRDKDSTESNPPWEEESFLILGIGEKQARQISAFWEQNAFVFGELDGKAKFIF